MMLFPQKFDDKADDEKHIRKADKKLIGKLRREASGVLYKLIRACLEWQKSGLNPPETVRAASDTYLASASTLLTWIEERLDKSNVHATITVNELWPNHVSWCEARRDVPCGRQNFNDKLENAGISIVRMSGQRRICKGVTLKVGEAI